MTQPHELPLQSGIEPGAQERKPLIPLRQSVIPACDVGELDVFGRLVRETGDIPKIGAY